MSIGVKLHTNVRTRTFLKNLFFTEIYWNVGDLLTYKTLKMLLKDQ